MIDHFHNIYVLLFIITVLFGMTRAGKNLMSKNPEEALQNVAEIPPEQ